MISEIDLPTEPSVSSEKEIAADSEKSESTFVELYEKYDEQFIKNSTTELKDVDETPLQKRSSPASDDDDIDTEANNKLIIEKIQTIDDPEVQKEFELDLNNNGQVNTVESEKSVDAGTEYDPNYSSKIVSTNENLPAPNSVANELENSVHDDFTSEDAAKILIDEFVTVAPEDFSTDQTNNKNPEIIEVIEQVFYHPKNVEVGDSTTVDPTSVQVDFDALNVQVDFEPIEIVHQNAADHFRSIEEVTTFPNDKFVGFEPSNELVEPLVETADSENLESEDESAKEAAEAIVDSLAIVGLLGKSINFDSSIGEPVVHKSDNKIKKLQNEIPETVYEETTSLPLFIESVTEVVEVNTKITVSIHIDDSNENSDSSDDKKSSASDKSSEESNSSKSSEKTDKTDKTDKADKADQNSSESSEENTAKEIFDKSDFRMLDLQNKDDQNKLMEDLYKDTMNHEVKKKDHPIVVNIQQAIERNLNEANEIAKQLDERLKIVETKMFEETTVGIYETFEDVVTTISDGIKLTNELRSSVDSFRGDTEENKTVLDTNNEAISSKNIKNSLVNIAEEMTLENHVVRSEFSYIAVSITGLVSSAVLGVLYVALKKKSASTVLFQ